jgi:hypothetical protein
MNQYNRRRATNFVVLTLSLGATALGLLVLFFILGRHPAAMAASAMRSMAAS